MATPTPTSINGASLGGVNVFCELDIADRESIAARCRSRRYKAGELVLTQDDPSQDVFFIISGKVRVQFIDRSGKDTLFRELYAGAMLGELSAIDGSPRSATIRAEEDSWLAFMNPKDFCDALATYPRIAFTTLRWVTELVRELSSRLHSFNALSVKQRVRVDILRMANETGVKDNQAAISSPPRHADIAARVGTHREGVTRELNELQRRGLLERRSGSDGRALIVTDVGKLQQMLEQ
ncbi:MAG: cyclic nucleotide-binding domain-containing protein [Gammaproteobacteria bacterium]|nr:cyclic nucleotide-binding domain-containing protein [Gammaproteobacteria bacterium]